MNFITGKSLARRTFLRGMGATLALPLLDSMIPALTAGATKAPVRLGFVFHPVGMILDKWMPATEGVSFEAKQAQWKQLAGQIKADDPSSKGGRLDAHYDEESKTLVTKVTLPLAGDGG